MSHRTYPIRRVDTATVFFYTCNTCICVYSDVEANIMDAEEDPWPYSEGTILGGEEGGEGVVWTLQHLEKSRDMGTCECLRGMYTW